jgi:cytidylate kinase
MSLRITASIWGGYFFSADCSKNRLERVKQRKFNKPAKRVTQRKKEERQRYTEGLGI